MRARTPHTLLTAAAAGAALALSACVSEVVPLSPANKPTNTLKGDPSKPSGPLNTTATGPGNLPPAAPAGTTASTRVAAAVAPLGSVAYDGLTLPLVTPDGKWIVTQVGPVPAWEAVLAEPGAAPQLGASIRAFRVIETPQAAPAPSAAASSGPPPAPPSALQLVDWDPAAQDTPTLDAPPSPTAGLLLGRAAGVDADGSNPWVLVERPNPDGSRWIGRLHLIDASIDWLVQGTDVNAQALLLRDGTLVYSRRKTDQSTTELVMLAPGAGATAPQGGAAPSNERVVRREGWKYCQPIATPDQSMIAVIAISADDTQLLAFSATQRDQAGAPLLLARYAMGAVGAAAAFQSVTSVEACPPDVESGLRASFLLINAERRRLALWEPTRGAATSVPQAGKVGLPGANTPAGIGSMSLLPAGAAAGVRTHSPVASGLVLASAKGMEFWYPGGVGARLITGAYIPRSFSSRDGTRLICFSPHAGSTVPTLDVVRVELVAPKQ